jgi:repressor LexA
MGDFSLMSEIPHQLYLSEGPLDFLGDSMKDVGLMDGDYVVVHREAGPVTGNIVVMGDSRAYVVKELAKDKDGLYLNSHNNDKKMFPDVRLTDDFLLVGAVAGSFRSYSPRSLR